MISICPLTWSTSTNKN